MDRLAPALHDAIPAPEVPLDVGVAQPLLGDERSPLGRREGRVEASLSGEVGPGGIIVRGREAHEVLDVYPDGRDGHLQARFGKLKRLPRHVGPDLIVREGEAVLHRLA